MHKVLEKPAGGGEVLAAKSFTIRAGDQGEVSASPHHPAETPHLVFSLLVWAQEVQLPPSDVGDGGPQPLDGIIEGEQQRQVFS